MKEQSTEASFKIIESNESLLVAKAMKDDVTFSLQYNKSECKKDGIDSCCFIDLYYPKDDAFFLM